MLTKTSQDQSVGTGKGLQASENAAYWRHQQFQGRDIKKGCCQIGRRKRVNGRKELWLSIGAEKGDPIYWHFVSGEYLFCFIAENRACLSIFS